MGRGGSAKGTPAYMAPELLDSNTFTEETDVYAYALAIWEVLTGDIPWRGRPSPRERRRTSSRSCSGAGPTSPTLD